MENSKIWIPVKNYFVLLLPLMAHKSNGGIVGLKSIRIYLNYEIHTKINIKFCLF